MPRESNDNDVCDVQTVREMKETNNETKESQFTENGRHPRRIKKKFIDEDTAERIEGLIERIREMGKVAREPKFGW